ncbi:MAG: hypothetical protein Tsb0013_07390 [Phycisphaerales bacterium]
MTRQLSVLAMVSVLGAAAQAQLLETNNDSLKTYLPGSATTVQDVHPHDLQRAVNFDGTTRWGNPSGANLGANPFGSLWPSTPVEGSIDLSTGAWSGGIAGISLPATVPWPVAVYYNAQQDGGSHVSDGYNGRNWIQSSQPELVLYEETAGSGSNDDEDLVYIVWGNGRYTEFLRQSGDDQDAEYDAFKGVNGVGGVVLFEAGAANEPDTYTLYDQSGTRFVFFGFDADASPAEGCLWKVVGTDGDAAYAGHETTGSTAISSGYDASGRILEAYDSSGREFNYVYSNLGAAGVRLSSVAAYDGATLVAATSYTYYTTFTSGKGSLGDLMQVLRITPTSESGRSTVDTTYLRYNTTGDYRLRLVVGPHGTFENSSTYFTDTDATLKPYADWYFEYDGSNRVDAYYTAGSCGCSGSIDGTSYIFYDTLTYTDDDGYDHEDALVAEVVLPEAYSGAAPLIRKVFMDEVGQRGTIVEYADADYDENDLLDVNDADGVPSEYWVTVVERDGTRGTAELVLPPHIADIDITSESFSEADFQDDHRFRTREFIASAGDMQGLPDAMNEMEAIGTTQSGAFEVLANDQTVTTVTKTIAGTVDVVRPYASDSTNPDGETTILTRAFHTGDAALREEKITTSRPVVSTSNNGSNSAVTSDAYYREDGTMAFVEHPDGRIDYTEIVDGLLVSRVTDVTADHSAANTEQGDFSGVTLPSSGNGYNLATEYTHDGQGRVETATGPTGRTSMTYRTDLDDDRMIVLSIPRYESGSGTYYSPVSVTLLNKRGNAVASGVIAFSGGSTTTAPSAWIDHTATDLDGAVDHGDLTSLTETVYDDSGARVTAVRTYYDIDGSAGNQYDEVTYAYDDLGRRIKTTDATGTIDRTVYDVRGRVVATWTGTSDTSFDPSSGGGNMFKVSETEYDSGATNGPGLVTERTLHVDGSTTRVTTYVYDDQNRLKVTQTPTYPYTVVGYDAIDRVEYRAQYTSSATLSASTDPSSYATGRISLSQTVYDEWGRGFKSVTKGINRSTGALLSQELTNQSWYDANGRVAKTAGSTISKTEYDSAGRAVRRYTLASDEDSGYAESVGGVQSDDIVVTQSQTVYDAEGRTVMSVTIDRPHDAAISGGGAVLGSLDSNADNDDDTVTAANLSGRPQISCTWHDELDRVESSAFYGTANLDSVTDFDYPATKPTSGDQIQTETVFDASGRVYETEDALGRITRYAYDDAGRRITQIVNYDDGTASAVADEDQITQWEYDDGLMVRMIATNYVSSVETQTTEYTYGVPKGTTYGYQSDIASNRLLYTVEYPVSYQAGAYDVVTYAYNALGERVYQQDENGTIIEYTRDGAGRVTAETALSLGTNIDGAVRRIETSYNELGQVTSVAQYDATSSGNVVDEVQYTYDNWGMLDLLEQDFNGAVAPSGGDEHGVNYFHAWTNAAASGGWEGVVRTGYFIASPTDADEQRVGIVRGGSGTLDKKLLRVSSVTVDSVTVAEYEYLGHSRIVSTELPVPEFRRAHYDGSGYDTHLDDFNRPVKDHWTREVSLASNYQADIIDRAIEYDKNSNILTIDHTVRGLDREFAIDGLDRVVNEERGTLSGGAITSALGFEGKTYDLLGNWEASTLDLDGDKDFADAGEFSRTATFNRGNEQLTRSDLGSNFAYDDAGQMVDDGENYEYVYDAWGRLVEVEDQSSDTVAFYRYNGLGQRIGWQIDTDADGTVETTGSDDPWTYALYNERWQLLGEHIADDGTSGAGAADDPDRLFVNHLADSSYIDSMILVDDDTDSDGVLEERTYYVQNWRHDVVALAESDGDVFEQTEYSKYGEGADLLRADLDQDGDVDASDQTAFSAQNPTADCSGGGGCTADFDLDGDVDGDDNTVFTAEYTTSYKDTVGTGLNDRAHARGYAGYVKDDAVLLMHVRHRVYRPDLGKWTKRDPLGYVDGGSLNGYVGRGVIRETDPHGLCSTCANSISNGTPIPISILPAPKSIPNIPTPIVPLGTLPYSEKPLEPLDVQPGCARDNLYSKCACYDCCLRDVNQQMRNCEQIALFEESNCRHLYTGTQATCYDYLLCRAEAVHDYQDCQLRLIRLLRDCNQECTDWLNNAPWVSDPSDCIGLVQRYRGQSVPKIC